MNPVRLSASASTSDHFDLTKCAICQKITPESLCCSANGCKRVRDASKVRNDIVTKRLKLVTPETEFSYHVTNDCYKKYTNSRQLKIIQEGQKSQQPPTNVTSEEPESPCRPATRSHSRSAVRSPPNPTSSQNTNKSANYAVFYSVSCVICDKKSHNREFKKFRISESNRASLFLNATNFFQDEIFGRVCDLQDEHAVFGADLYYHKSCMTSYLQKFETASHATTDRPQMNSKQRAWNDIVSELEQGLKSGIGYELSAIRDKLNSLVDVQDQFRNRDVKIFLLKHFGSSIDFTPSSEPRKSLMAFSATCNKADVLAERIRSIDPIQVCASVIRQSLDSYDFDLDDSFGDAQDLKRACSNMAIPEPLINFFGYLYNFKPSTYPQAAENVMSEPESTTEDEDGDDEEDGDESEERNASDTRATDGCLTTQRCRKIQAIFQTMYYVHHRGRKRTPLHIMNAESAHSLGRGGKIFTTILNRQGLALSYAELRRYQYDMAAYTAKQNEQVIALPAHFDPGEFTSSAFDNWDHEGTNSSEHDTVCVLYQDKPASQLFKPKRSNTSVEHGPQAFTETLPCQNLQEFEARVTRPELPSSFKGNARLYQADDTEEKTLKDIAWSIGRLNLEVTDNQMARLLYPQLQTMPSWSASNAIWTDEHVPVKQVAFLPVLPYPVTLYSTVYTQMKNLVAIGSQLVQQNLPVYADEKVYSMAKEIQLLRSEEFKNLVICLGTFHTAKTLLRITGKSLVGSGAENVWLEAGVFGPAVIQNSVLNGGHYNRSLDGQKLLAESMQRLLYKEFFEEKGIAEYSHELQILGQLKKSTADGDILESKRLLDQFQTASSQLIDDLTTFIKTRTSSNENFRFWHQFLKRHEITLDLLRADREGSWDLHLDAMQRALYEFAAWDATNYLRWGTVYLEDARCLPETAPEVFRNFSEGHSFSVKETPSRFTAVGGDQKLEQTINLSSKCSDGVIGHAKQKQYIAQWDLIYHEMMAVTNLHREYSGFNENTSDAWQHHESSQSATDKKEAYIQKMMKYIEERGSPFSSECPPVLHNFVTKEVMTEEIRKDILNASDTGKKKYEQFHKQRIINKTSKLSDTIHRTNLTTMASIKTKAPKTTKQVIKRRNMTERCIEIARDRGLGTEELLRYDVVPSTLLFDDDDGLMTKPEKSQLIRELEEKLKPEDYSYHHKPESAFMIDVMAAVRRVPTNGLTHFCDLLSKFTEITTDLYHCYGRCDFIFDIYDDKPSVKDTERLRRCSETPVVLSTIDHRTPLPKNMATFWPSSQNKVLLERLIYNHLREQTSHGNGQPTILSQLCIDSDEWQSVKILNSVESEIPQLQSTTEEADLRIPMHVLDCLRTGYTTCVVISNDTDVIIALLFYMSIFIQEGLSELWVRAGRGNTVRFIPLHILHERLGPDLCAVLPALHSLTGCDITSKVGTKKAALKASPELHLQEFGTTTPLCAAAIQHAEQYLANVMDAKSTSSNFQELREHRFHFSKSASHQNLPPTSQALEPHIHRAFYNAYTTMHALDKQLNIAARDLDPVDNGFELQDGHLLPSTSWKTLEACWSVVCQCGKCARVTCPCRTAQVRCSVFCKCQKTTSCKNPNNMRD